MISSNRAGLPTNWACTTTGEPLEYAFTAGNDFSDFSTIIEYEATLNVVHLDLDSLDWELDGRDLDGRPMIEVSLDADIDLDGMAFKSDYYSDDDASVDVLDSDWNDHYVWVATHHKGHLSLMVYLTPDGTGVDAVELVNADEIVPEPTSGP
jgi:hypothetical protein